MSAMNQKINETGWFYHAPAPRMAEKPEPVGAPPPSQIPMLGDMEAPEPEVPQEMVFRDTDTKYIRMAKMGGRKDLLSIRPNPGTKKEAVGYPRSEWFYLEDNALQDRAEKEAEQEDWKFLLPEYMVHQTHGDTDMECPSSDQPRRPYPFATNNKTSQFEQDGRAMTDKTVRIPETLRPGYGIRQGKPAPRGPRAEKPKPGTSQVQGERPRLRGMPLPKDDEGPINMTKLLAGTYEREWHDRVNDWEGKQARNAERTKAFIASDGPARSEYNNNYAPQHSAGSQRNQRRISSGASQKNKKDEEKREPFKMSRFKNVPARISSHQSSDYLAAVGN